MKLYLTEDSSLRDSGFSNSVNSVKQPRHRWYPVKEALSPELFEHAIKTVELPKGSLIFDPFSGSGTVCLAASETGFRARAMEVNPFLAFLGQTKLTKPGLLEAKRELEKLRSACDSDEACQLEKFSSFSSLGGREKWLFPLKALRAGMSGLKYLDSNKGQANPILKLAVIGSLMDCCNAFRDGKCLRYKREWADNEASRADFFDFLETRTNIIFDDLKNGPEIESNAEVWHGDVRSELQSKNLNAVDFILTSPPYLNSFDYSDIYRPEMFLGGFVADNSELMKIRLRTLRSHVQASWELPKARNFGSLYMKAMSEIEPQQKSLWNKNIPLMIQAYFEDIGNLMKTLRERANPHCQAWIVVSTSAYAGVEVPVDLIFAEMASQYGWMFKQVAVMRHLRGSSQYAQNFEDVAKRGVPLRESVVILEADPRWKIGKLPRGQ